jgi:hypothetical protein
MPRALAKVGDHVVAETETWETVEGNIYVCATFPVLPILSQPMGRP